MDELEAEYISLVGLRSPLRAAVTKCYKEIAKFSSYDISKIKAIYRGFKEKVINLRNMM